MEETDPDRIYGQTREQDGPVSALDVGNNEIVFVSNTPLNSGDGCFGEPEVGGST